MRHKVKSTTLNRPTSQLKALRRSLVTSIILYEDVETTKEKARMASAAVDRVISTAKRKKDEREAIRYISKYVLDANASKKIITELVKRFENRDSGFTRFVQTRIRKGDNANLGRIQLLDS